VSVHKTRFVTALVLALVCLAPVAAQRTPQRPRLVLVVAIDQMRFDYLTRFAPLYTGGLRTLRERGAVFSNANYRHAATETGPGHSVILSGRHPSHSGIVANDWWDPLLKKVVNVVDDPVQSPLGGAGRGASPVNALGFTVGDVLKLKSPQSRVVGVSLKDRSAILMAGRRGDAAYWYETAEGRFITQEDLTRSAKVVVLGSTRREELFGGRPALGQLVSIGGDRYTVVGVMERKEFYWNSANRNNLEWMNRFVFVPVTSMITRMAGDRENQKVAYINVQVRDVKDMEKAQEQVTTVLRRAHGGVTDFQVFNRQAFMRQQEQQGRIYDITFLTCGAISLLVGGIVIMNILLASFNERVREVGTRKALGATGLNIMAQFLVESVVVTIFGGLLGLGLGVGFTTAMSRMIQQPVMLTPQIMLLGLSFAVAVGIFFGFYPAIRAARLNPIEALRYE